MMLFGAYAAGASELASHNVLLGLLTGSAAGLVIGILQANLSHRLQLKEAL